MERRPVLDTAPRSWGELLDDERQLLEGLNRFIGHCLNGAARIEARQQHNLGGRRPRIDRVREGRVAMLNGPRGTGKTTLLLTAMAWWTCPEEQQSSRADLDDGPSGGPRAFAEIGQRIACLDLLDFDPQPPGMPVYAWLVHAFQPLVDAIDATTPRDARRGDEPDLLTRWNRLAENAAIGWQTESRWPLPSADAEIDASQKTERWLNLSHHWRAFIDALLQAEPTIELVLVPVDDIDMQPRGALDLLQAMRVFYHPRVLFVLTGDRAHLERVVRRELAGRMSQASPSIEPNEAPELAKALVDKSIPRAQTFPVRALSWLEALDWQSGVLRERLGERARGWNAEGLPALTEPTLPIRSVAHVVAGATTAEALMAELVEHARPQGWLSVRDLPEPLFGFEVQVPGSLVAYAVSHGGADLGPMIAHHTGVGWAPAGTRLDGLHSLTEIQRAPPAVVALAEAGVLGTNRIFGHVVGGLVQSMYNWHGRTVFLPWPMMTFSRPSTPARMLRRFRELYEDVDRFDQIMFGPTKEAAVESWLALHIEHAASERGFRGRPDGEGWAKLVEFARENLIFLGPRFAEWLRDRLPILAAPEFGLSAPMQEALLALGESVALPPGKSDELAEIFDRRKASSPWDGARRSHLDREAYLAGGDRLDIDSFTDEVERQATNSPWYTRYRSAPKVDAALEKWLDVEVRGRTVYSWLSRADLETGTLSERVRLLHRRDGQGRWDLDHWGTHRIQAVLEKVDWTKSLDPMQRTSSASAHFWMARIWSTLVAACLELDMLSGELAAEIGGWVVLTDGWLDSEWAGPRLTCVPELDVDPEHQWMMEGTDLVLAVPNAWKVECPELSDVEPAGRDALGAWAMVLQSVWHDLGRPVARLQFERPRVLDPEDVLPMPPLATWVEAERYCIWWRKNIETLASAQLPQGSAPVARAALVERWLDRIPEIMKPTPDGRAIDEPDAPDYPRPPDRLRNAARGLPGPDKAPDLVDWWAEVNPGALLQGAQREAVEAGLVEARQPPGIEIVF